MFNFFDEIREKSINKELLSDFNIVNISCQLLYVEGHMGISKLAPEEIAFKVKRGRVVVEGEDLKLGELTENTMIIEGKIKRMEIF